MKLVPNRDLEVIEGNKARWSHADNRRHSLHNLHRIARYGVMFRSAWTMCLEKRMDLRIAECELVRRVTSLPWFSAMVVIRDQHILFERYASDFDARQCHSIQSISKTLINLIIGRLVESQALDLSRPVRDYLPQIGSAYADATLQEVLNMNVLNEYSEDFSDLQSTYYRHEEAMGWRLPADPRREQTQTGFIAGLSGPGVKNHSGVVQYKDANTDVLGWIAERVTGRPLRLFLADIADAAGFEDALHLTTDREGFPTLDGGACMTPRDLARYFSIFVRGGRGISGESVGSHAFIDLTAEPGAGIPMEYPYEGIRYSNHLMVCDDCLGHGGWAGQYVLANRKTKVVAVFLSVTETHHAINRDYLGPVIHMLKTVAELPP